VHTEKKMQNQSNQISQLYMNSHYSDVIFVVEDKKIFAHKMLLGIRCQFFSNMFSSILSEFHLFLFLGQMSESNQKEIEIKDCKARTFEGILKSFFPNKILFFELALLKYIYCNEVDLTDELALDLLVLCKKWLFKELEGECEDFLAETLKIENIVERAQLADQLEAGKLVNHIIEFIIPNMSELETRGILYQISSAIIVKALVELKNKKLQGKIE